MSWDADSAAVILREIITAEDAGEGWADAYKRAETFLATTPQPLDGVTEEEPLGEPVDPRFMPTRSDLDALRKDCSDLEDREGLPVKVHVAPAVLYMAWPNSQYKPDDGSSPYRCISFHIPKPSTLSNPKPEE